MIKYGVTLRTTRRLLYNETECARDVHNVILCRGLDFYQASKYFNGMAYQFRLLFGRTASTTRSRGGQVMSVEWLVQTGEPGDDVSIFIDEYEDE